MALSDGSEVSGEFDVAVVGSGYGGGVMATRLARAGLRVVVLERGKEYASEDFPARFDELRRETQVSVGPSRLGSRQALVDVRVGKDLSVLVGCGLGGTSLINANVSIQPSARVFAELGWPAALQQPGALDAYYARASEMLRPTPVPEAAPKLVQLQESAAAANFPCRKADINVNYSETIPGQKRCVECGNCIMGCRYDAKNTICATYLPLAKAAGARLFTRCSVSYVERLPSGAWVVHYDQLDPHDRAIAKTLHVRAVVLGAGALGSTEILMRSRDRGLSVSAKLGRQFSGNGDSLAIGYNFKRRLDSVGWGSAAQGPKVGPSITGIVDLRDDTSPIEESIIIEDGAFPGSLTALLREVLEGATVRNDDEPTVPPLEWLEKRWREMHDLLGFGHRDGALDHSQVYLCMGHDGSGGVLGLVDDRIQITWPGLADLRVFARSDTAARALTKSDGGGHVQNPLEYKLNSLLTVHPLGGCPMGDDSTVGVVDDRGRVWDPDNPGATHGGLYIADGAIVPSSVGVNPLLTITALAERIAELAVVDLLTSLPSERHGRCSDPGQDAAVDVRRV